MSTKPSSFPPQSQDTQPGKQAPMDPQPQVEAPWYKGSGKLQDKVVFITGGDSGIGQAVAILCAREGAHIAIAYLEETEDAQKTKTLVEKEGKKCLLLRTDVKEKALCEEAVAETVKEFGRLNCLINNAALQFEQTEVEAISNDQLRTTFETNIFSYFYCVQAALPHLKKQKGSTIINTTSVTAYRGSSHLLDYSSTKGAIVTFTRSLSANLASTGIRVNGVAPGPVWTPLIVSSFPPDQVKKFGQDVPLGRAGQPEEIAPAFVFLASQDSSYMTGQVLHVNGGEIVNT